MKQLVVLSGKGGTGKTTIAGALIYLSNAKAYADCDVDAPNLHLLFKNQQNPKIKDYIGLQKALIDSNFCTKCGICYKNCRFCAIKFDGHYRVDKYACEGCAVCEMVCPTKAITMNDNVAGELKLFKDDSVFSTATLNIGEGTSGLLVSEVKNQLIDDAKNVEIAIIDGSPGIGCPVIATLSGATFALLVVEPSISGISDMQRIIKTATYFDIKLAICINKYDTSAINTEKIEKFCTKNNLTIIGKIPYDKTAVKANNDGLSIAEIDCKAGEAVKKVYKNLINFIKS